MIKKVHSASSSIPPDPAVEFPVYFGNKRWDYILLGTAGILVLTLFIYGIWLGKTAKTSIRYSPLDVIYGETLHAVHDMNPNGSGHDSIITSAGSSEKPEIRLSEKYVNFGEVDAPKVLTHTFVIANSGQSMLIIQRAYTTCGCTIADFTATEIPPGKVALMTLQFDTGYHDLRGTTVRRGVMIETNDPEHPQQEIWIQASVK